MKSPGILSMSVCALLLAAGALNSQQPPQPGQSQPPKRVMPGTIDPDKANGQPSNTSTTKPFTPPAKTSDADGPVIRSTVQVVLVPTLVTDKRGNSINGLRVNDFTLYDNDKPQRVDRDIAFLPLSMVICIQRSANVEIGRAHV